MAENGNPVNLSQNSLASNIQIPTTDLKNQSMQPPLPAPQNNKVALAPSHQLPTHLIRLLEEWHKYHREEAPCASQIKKMAPGVSEDGSKTQKYFSRDSQEIGPLKEITITRPTRYNIYYLPISDEDGTGVLVKLISSGPLRLFAKKWIGGYKFQAKPVAVRLTGKNGNFPPFPDDDMWDSFTAKRFPVEMKEEKLREAVLSTVPSKRDREQHSEYAESDSLSRSSSGVDIPPRKTTKVSRRTRSSSHLSTDDSSDSASEEEVEDEEDEDEDEDKKDQAAPAGLSNGGLPVISRSMSHTDLVRNSPNARSQSNKTTPARKSPSNQPHARSPFVDTIGTASDSGIEIPTSSDGSTLANIIKFKFLVPRTKMARDLRAENNEDNSGYLFNQAREFFRRYDRLVGTPVLECVVEGEQECRCIYNAKELSYLIEELRERRGIVKVTVTQTV